MSRFTGSDRISLGVVRDEARRAQRKYLDALVRGEDPAETNRLHQDLYHAEQQVQNLTRRQRGGHR